jgi:hypothetical protein
MGGTAFNDSESEGEGEEWVNANEAKEYVTSPFDLPAHLLWTCCLELLLCVHLLLSTRLLITVPPQS